MSEAPYAVKRLRRPPPRHLRLAIPLVVLLGLLVVGTGSVVLAVALLTVFGGLAAGLLFAARAAGLDLSSPIIQRLRARPWRDPEATFRAALRHLPSAFVIGLRGQVFAPPLVEIALSWRYLAELEELMDRRLVTQFANEEYASVVKAYGATAHGGPLTPSVSRVLVRGSADVPDGAFTIRRRPIAHGREGEDFQATSLLKESPDLGLVSCPPHPTHSRSDNHDGLTVNDSLPTSMEKTPDYDRQQGPQLQQLGLETNGAWRWTGASPATAGRDPRCALPLPLPSTVSRHHAEFRCEAGAWWVIARGRNGLQVNGRPVTEKTLVNDEDRITWGSLSTSPSSMVRISRT